MRPEPDRVDLGLALVAHVGLNHVSREHVAGEQERVVGLERVQARLERPWDASDRRERLLRQLVDVSVERLAGVELALDPVEPREHQSGESEVGAEACPSSPPM
jgi:hypothetical protein